MSEMKLLPCPFCGGEAKLKSSAFFTHNAYVRCKECGVRTLEFSSATSEDAILKAVKAWNTRSPVEDVLERLEAECIKYKNEWNTYDDEVAFGQMNGMSNAISIIKEGLMK